MQQSETTNKRSSFRMPAGEFESGAGIVIGKKVIPAQMIDYSLNGCCLGFEKPFEVDSGDQIRVATSKGQYTGIVRRVESGTNEHSLLLGVEFTELLDDKYKQKNSTHLLAVDGKHSLGGNLSLGLIAGTVVSWSVVAYVLYWLLTQYR